MQIIKVCISKIVSGERWGEGGVGKSGDGVGGEFLLKKDTPTKTQQTKGQW